MYLPAVHFTDRVTMQGDQIDDGFRKRNFDLCRALDLTKFAIALNDMVEAGMPIGIANIYDAQANALRAAILTENNRLWAQQRARAALAAKEEQR